jgi:hypothetical protein
MSRNVDQHAKAMARCTISDVEEELMIELERRLLGEQSYEDWEAEVKRRLPKERLPALSAPAHLEVMKRVKDWLSMDYITAEHAKVLQQHVLENSRVAVGVMPASGSLCTKFDEARNKGSPGCSADTGQQKRAASQIEGDAVETEAPSAKKSAPVKLQQATLSFGKSLSVMSPRSATAATLPVVEQLLAAPGAKPEVNEVKAERCKVKAEAGLTARVKLVLKVVSMKGMALGVACLTTVAMVPMLFGEITNKRRKFSDAERATALAATAGMSASKAAIALKHMVGYEKVQRKQIVAWANPKVKQKVGRKVDEEFERQVLDQLVYTTVANANDPASVTVLANVAYSYSVIRAAAEMVQKWPQFSAAEKVMKLKFSQSWIHGFITRAALHKRAVTTTEKNLPSVAEVQEVMAKIQEWLVKNEYTLDETVSADETGIFYGAQPKCQFVPDSVDRASAPESDEKARITDMLWGKGSGEMGPHFCIIPCSSKKPDLSSTRVLKELHKKPGFTEADGWEMHTWTRTIQVLDRKKQEVETKYTRPYLICKSTGDIITIQHKAWMDTAGCCMWIDLSIGPHYDKRRKKAGLIWDSCGPHKTPAVKSVLSAWGIEEKKLPVNMTGKLQAMDLVGNGPMKAGIRRERIGNLFDYFQSWKIQRLQAKADEKELPTFKPPKADLVSGLLTLFKVGHDAFSKQSYKEGLARCFVKIGQAPQQDGSFVRYTSHGGGSMLKVLFPVGSPEAETGTLATIAGGTDVEACPDEEPESEDEEEEEE